MVKAGKMIWKLMTKANCTRDRKTGSNSMTKLLIGSRGSRRRRWLLQLPSTPRITIFALLISVGKAGDT